MQFPFFPALMLLFLCCLDSGNGWKVNVHWTEDRKSDVFKFYLIILRLFVLFFSQSISIFLQTFITWKLFQVKMFLGSFFLMYWRETVFSTLSLRGNYLVGNDIILIHNIGWFIRNYILWIWEILYFFINIFSIFIKKLDENYGQYKQKYLAASRV